MNPGQKIRNRECVECGQTLKPAEVGEQYCKTCRAWDRYFHHTEMAKKYLSAAQ